MWCLTVHRARVWGLFFFLSVANQILFPKIYICFKTKTLSKWALKSQLIPPAAHPQHLCVNEAPKGLLFSLDFSVLPCYKDCFASLLTFPAISTRLFLKFLVLSTTTSPPPRPQISISTSFHVFPTAGSHPRPFPLIPHVQTQNLEDHVISASQTCPCFWSSCYCLNSNSLGALGSLHGTEMNIQMIWNQRSLFLTHIDCLLTAWHWKNNLTFLVLPPLKVGIRPISQACSWVNEIVCVPEA